MAFQPESATYDAGVYQIETLDPVQGGVGGISNKGLLALANRTAYLKQHVDAIEAGSFTIPGYAKLASPTFTGTPLAPTPALADDSTKLATTAFVQDTVYGVLTKSVAGGVNVSLTAVEAGNGILIFTGALTANIAVIVPSVAKAWIVYNNTTGPYTLTVKTAAGAGADVQQTFAALVYCDATNCALGAGSNLVKRSGDTMLGALDLYTGSTAATPAQFDNSTKVATTAFVRTHQGAMRGETSFTAAATLTAANIGTEVYCGGSTTYALTLPLISASPAGSMIVLVCANTAGITAQRQGTDPISTGNGSTVTSLPLGLGDTLILMSNGASWLAIGGTARLKYTSAFTHVLSSSGYQRFPSGLTIQWGGAITNASGAATVTFPIAFNGAPYTYSFASASINATVRPTTSSATQMSFEARFAASGALVDGGSVAWMAIGY